MKIAIKGHPTRGKEVIQILKSLGGKTIFAGLGFDERYYYYINPNSIIIEKSLITIKTKDEFKLYTLEEFEKEFPFKVGDKVTFKKIDTHPYTIKSFSVWSDGDIVCEFEETMLHYPLHELKYYKEMKEERNITLTLDKAKEWYKKGGELREIALQAFTENELNPLPRSWEEFCKKHPIKEGESYINSEGKILSFTTKTARRDWDHICPSKQSTEAHLALMQLEQLRDCWRQGWIPNWLEGNVTKYVIQKWRDRISIETTYVTHSFLSFPTYEMAKEFLKCFRDLIEKAGDLI